MIEEKINEKGLNIPEAPKPLAAYLPYVLNEKTIYTAGQLPLVNGKLKFVGKLGKELSIDEGMEAAKLCVLNCLGVLKTAAGSLDNIDQIMKITVFVNSSDGFTDQPKVANGASEFLVEIFGEKGKHARSAVGVNELPINSPIEIELIAKLK